ncbi:hypothetical protein A9Q99_24010 [Gammaproteobacteria bacterium 45_16_T64]|nr:hypothetical protein A9Q99_24010 [Gammaproteobacteria bacterium 45_16_T64]
MTDATSTIENESDKTVERKKVAFVTGSTGFLGLHIVKQLADDGWDVLALRRCTSRTSDLDKLAARQVEGDVLNKESLEIAVPDNVDAIFHVAADTSMWEKKNEWQNRVNIEGARNVVEIALKKNAGRLIHTSSIGAYGKTEGVEISEAVPSRAMESGINYYRSKFLAEQEIHKGIAKGLDAVIMNPCQIVGPLDYNYTPLIFQNLKSGAMKGIPQGSSVLGHVRDYAKAHVTAYDKGRTGENYLLGGVHASFQDVFNTVGAILHVKTPTAPLPKPLLSFAAFVLGKISLFTNKEPLLTPEKVTLMNDKMVVSSKKAEDELGFTTCTLQEMFMDSYQWMQREQII